MADYNAGEARLAIVPDISQFKKKLAADMSTVKAEFALPVTANTAQARADINRFREVQQRNSVNLDVDVALRDAEARMAAFRARQRANSIKADVEITGLDKFQQINKEISSAGAALASFGKVNLTMVGIGSIPAATAAVVELAGALQQLAQAGLAVPGAIAGVGASVGTLAVGLSGVKDAWDAIGKAAEPSGGSQVRSANDAARSQRDLANAYRDTRREIEDLNISLRGDQLSEQEAMINAQKARRDLQRDLASGQIKDNLDLQSRMLDIEQADQRVVESHQRLINKQEDVDDANAKGVEGSDRVVAAHEAIAGAAASAGAGTDKAAQAMAKLAPNAREFVQALVDLKPQFTDLQQSAQQNLFAGLSTQLRTLVDADLPHLKDGMSGIATAWNQNLTQLMKSLGSKNSQGLLDRILGNTAVAQANFTKAIDPLVRGIGTLTAAGTDVLPRLADGLAAVGERFRAFIEAADADGRLDKWMNDGITGLTQLGNTLLNIGKSFTAITEAAGGGNGFLGTLEKGSKKLSDFLNSDVGQAKLRDFFQQARDDLAQWRPILEQLPGVFANVVGAARDWMNGWLPLIREAVDLLGKHPALIKEIIDAFALWKGITAVSDLAKSLNNISDLLGFAGTGKKGEGGKGVLGKLSLAAAGLAALNLLDPSNPLAGPDVPSAGDVAANYGGNAASGAIAGAPFGLPGLVLGTGAGVVKSIYDQGAGDIQREKDRVAREGLPAPVGGAKPPQGPDAQTDLRAKIAAGQMPGYTLGPNGEILQLGPNGELIPIPLPGYDQGGPTRSGRGNGPTGGWISELHGDEWVLPAHARKAVGDKALWALTSGRSFEPGGFIDPYGNPVTPGAAPGSSTVGGVPPVAPNTQGGGFLSGFLSGMSGLSGVMGSLAGLAGTGTAGTGVDPNTTVHGTATGAAPGPAGGASMSLADRASSLPGLWGLIGSMNSSNPDLAMANWGKDTGAWLGGFAAKTLTSFGSTLYQGALGAVGLQNSILSPSNPWFQAGTGVAGFALGQDGPLGKLSGVGGVSSDLMATPTLGTQTITQGDGSTISIPTYGTSGDGIAMSSASSDSVKGSGWWEGASIPLSGKGAERWRPVVRAQLAKYGPRLGVTNYKAWEDALIRQIATESGGNPGADNPNDTNGRGGSQHVSGLLQFLPATFNANNISGGSYLDPAAQIAAAIPYVMNKYGVGGDGSPNQIGRGVGYDTGGWLMPGVSLAVNGTRKPEAIVTHDQGKDLEKIAQHIDTQPPAAPGPNAVQVPPPAPGAPGGPPPGPTDPAPQPQVPGFTPVAPSSATSSIGGAIGTGLQSGFNAAGTAVGTAASLAATAGSFGAAGPASGAIGSLAGGLFSEGGKIAAGAAQAVSSLLIGTAPGSLGPQGNAYGTPLRPAQNVPITAPTPMPGGGGTTNYFNGISDIQRLQDMMELRDAQRAQGGLARWRG